MIVMKKWQLHQETEFMDGTQSNASQIKYKGQIFNYSLIKDTVSIDFAKYAEEKGMSLTDSNFETYCDEHPSAVKEILEKFYDRRQRRSQYKAAESKH